MQSWDLIRTALNNDWHLHPNGQRNLIRHTKHLQIVPLVTGGCQSAPHVFIWLIFTPPFLTESQRDLYLLPGLTLIGKYVNHHTESWTNLGSWPKTGTSIEANARSPDR